MTAARPDYAARITALARLMADKDIAQAAFVPGPNFYYLTGLSFHLMERPTLLVVHSDARVTAVMPALEKSQWQAAMPDAETHYWADADGFTTAFKQAFARLTGRLAVEGLRMRVRELNAVRHANPHLQIADEQELISSVRLCKQAAEIEIVTQAITISEKALAQACETVAVGMTEIDLKRTLLAAMLEQGGDGPAFNPIVLFGAATADCHGHATTRKLQAGDAILIDFGAAFGGYNADITRTFFAKHCDGFARDVYNTVLAANEKGRQIARAGLTAGDLDAGVTQVLADSDFRDYIVHKTGHGLGIDVHEWPQIMVGNDQKLADGMLFTIEPGLYKQGALGVRIEDDVVICASGCRSLTTFPRDLTYLGE